MPVRNNSYSTLHFSRLSPAARRSPVTISRAPFNTRRRQQSLSLPFDRGSIVTRASTRLHSWLHPIAAALRVTARFVARTRFPRRVRRERASLSLFYCNATESATKSPVNARGNATCWPPTAHVAINNYRAALISVGGQPFRVNFLPRLRDAAFVLTPNRDHVRLRSIFALRKPAVKDGTLNGGLIDTF